MNRLLFRATFVIASAVVFLLAAMPARAGKVVSVPVQAQPLQILGADGFCSSWTAGTDSVSGNPTLTCVPITNTGAPSGCTATVNGTSSVTLPNAGGSVNLAAGCTSPSTGLAYNWTRNGAPGATSASWNDTLPANTGTTISNTTSYQVSICVGSACVTVPATPLTAIVPPASAPTGAPTGCVASINGTTTVSLAASGGSVNLTASCTNPASGITYSWTRNGASASNLANWTDTPPANTSTTNTSTTTYQVQACNGSACVTVPQTALTAVRAAAQTSTAWNGTCPGFDTTALLTMDWNHPARLYTRDVGGFTPRGVVVVQFTTGSVSSTNMLPRIAAAEFSSSPSSRIATLSPTPCDFGPQAALGAAGEGNSVTMVFALGTGSGYGYYPVLQLNTTYYLNIKNSPNATCIANGVCDMFIDLVKSGGL